MFNANNISVSWPRDSDSRRQIVRSDEILSHIWFSFYDRTLSNVQRQLSTWSNALQSVAKNLDGLLHYSILGPIAIFLQLCNYQFEMSEANKSSHDWCEPKLWSIVSRPLIEKLLKCQKQTLGYEAWVCKEEAVCLFYNYLFSWVVSRFNLV